LAEQDLKGWRLQVPSVPKSTGVLCLFLNFFIPGLGTLVAGLQANSSSCVVIGIMQLLLLPCALIGWIWSIWWGVLIYKKSKYHEAVLLGISIYSQA